MEHPGHDTPDHHFGVGSDRNGRVARMFGAEERAVAVAKAHTLLGFHAHKDDTIRLHEDKDGEGAAIRTRTPSL